MIAGPSGPAHVSLPIPLCTVLEILSVWRLFIWRYLGTVQEQEEFVTQQEKLLLEEQKGLYGIASDSDQESREASGKLEIKGVMLRAMSLEIDRFVIQPL